MRKFWSLFGVDVLALVGICLLPVLLRGEPLPSSAGTGESYTADADAPIGEIGEHLFDGPGNMDAEEFQMTTMSHCDMPPGVPEPATLVLGLTALGVGLGAQALSKRLGAESQT